MRIYDSVFEFPLILDLFLQLISAKINDAYSIILTILNVPALYFSKRNS